MKFLNFTIIFITVFSITVFSEEKIQNQNSNLQTIKLALNWLPEPQFGGFYQALFAEEYKNKNLDVEIIKGGSGTPTVQMLVKGTVDFAIVSAEEILLSNDKNHKNQVVALFATYQTNPQMIMSHKEKNYSGISDILKNEGYLAWQSGLSYSLFLRNKYPNVKVKMVPYLGGLTQFQKDKNLSQQGFITSEPLSAEKLGLKIDTFMVADEGFNPYTTVLAVRKDYYKKNKELVEKMVSATKKGWQDYLKDPSFTNKKMHNLNPAMDLETFAKSAKSQVQLIQNPNGLGIMTSDRWKTLVAQMKELGLIKKNFKTEELYLNF